MKKFAIILALALLNVTDASARATADFRVVVPLYGKQVVAEGLALSPGELPPGTVSEPYEEFDFNALLQVTPAAPAGSVNVTWSVIGSLPAGLTLTASGILTGTPSPAAVTAGPFTVSATRAGLVASQSYQLGVSEAQIPEEPSTGEPMTEGSLTVAPATLRFGKVARLLPSKPLKALITNTGSEAAPLIIGQPENSEFAVSHACLEKLGAGASCEVSVEFTPKTTKKQISGFAVQLGSDTVTMAIDGTGQNSSTEFTHLPLKRPYQDFGIVAPSQVTSRQTVVRNSSKYYALKFWDAMSVRDYTVDDASPHFSVDKGNCPPVLAVGESCVVTTQFAPVAAGAISDYIRLKMNVFNDKRHFNVLGRAAGDLTIKNLSHKGAHLSGVHKLLISGTGIVPEAKVFFGDIQVESIYASLSAIYAVVPEISKPENTTVRIVNPDGAEATSAEAFARAIAFPEFSVSSNVDFGKFPIGVSSQWKNVSLRNKSSYIVDKLEINEVQVSGPFELNKNSVYCAPGRVVSYESSCTIQIRFKPSESGAAAGELTVVTNGEPHTLPLLGVGLVWDGVPSGSAAEFTDLPYSTVLSANENVGGASQTRFVDVYLRNTKADATLWAYFNLANGSAFKLYSISKVSSAGAAQSVSCLPSTTATASTLCRADIGSGSQPHLRVRLQATSAAGLGTHYEELVVMDASGVEQFRIPLWLDNVYDVVSEAYESQAFTEPVTTVSVSNAPLAQEGYKDIWLANLGTHGMLRTEDVRLLYASDDIYLKADSLYKAKSGSGVSTCGASLNTTSEVAGCLSDDVAGASTGFPNQRIRVYYKPMSAGLRSASLQITHRGQGRNPIDVAMAIEPVSSNAIFSGAPASQPKVDVPTFKAPYNFDVDGTYAVVTKSVYLNSTDGQPLKGYFRLSGPGTENQYVAWDVAPASDAGAASTTCAMSNRLETKLCGSPTAPHFVVKLKVDTRIGDNSFTWNLEFFDPSMQPIASLPVRFDVINDAQAELSEELSFTQNPAGGIVDFGVAAGSFSLGQVPDTLLKNIVIRNAGTNGKLKISSAEIEGGDGAFTFTAAARTLSDSSSGLDAAGTSCGSTRPEPQRITSCVTSDPSVNPAEANRHARLKLAYNVKTMGKAEANLKVWHNSKTVANPLIIPLTATAEDVHVAGEFSETYSQTIAPSGIFLTKVPASGGTTTLSLVLRNPLPNQILYAEEITVEGTYFKLSGVPRIVNNTNMSSACESQLSADGRSASPCQAQRYATAYGVAAYPHIRFALACVMPKDVPAGIYTGALVVKTKGAAHRIPLSCQKS